MFFQQQQNSHQQLFPMQPSETIMFQLCLTIPIVGANDDCQRCFAKDKLVKRAQKWLKMAKKSELLLFVKTLV